MIYMLYLYNGKIVDKDHQLTGGDEIIFIPAVFGDSVLNRMFPLIQDKNLRLLDWKN